MTYFKNQVKQTFYTSFIDENSTDHKRLFRATKQLLAKKEEWSFPNYQDKSKLANDIGSFFVRKINRIRSDIDAVDIDLSVRNALPSDQEVDAAPTFHSFQPLSKNAVSALTRKSPEKASRTPMATSLAVGCLDVLLPVIPRIVNLSLSCGHFSDEWKEALVTPILKKPGLDPTQLNTEPPPRQ